MEGDRVDAGTEKAFLEGETGTWLVPSRGQRCSMRPFMGGILSHPRSLFFARKQLHLGDQDAT